MSWVSRLCETYDNCSGDVLSADITGDTLPLLPIGHTTQYAQIEITLDDQGNFLRARALEKSEANTIIPCTEKSAGRTSGLSPHPLFDKLQYIAGDYSEYVPEKESGFLLYSEQLKQWCDSPYGNPVIRSVYTYTQKQTVIHDLIRNGVLCLDESGKIMDSWEGDGDKPIIFTQTAAPSDSFVRFRVETIGKEGETRVWLMPQVRKDFIAYYQSIFPDKELCYVTGIQTSVSQQSSAKIRNLGDKAKLVSSNDTSGFTYRGRFIESSQAVMQSYEVSQKSVNALKWLIDKQGYKNGDQVIVAWATNNVPVPKPCESYDEFDQEDEGTDTAAEFAKRLNNAIAGYAANLDDTTNVVVMGLDSATPGRLSITYYRELTGSEFLERIRKWQLSANWYPLVKLKQIDEKKITWVKYRGTPVPKDIAEAAYGRSINDKLKKATVERLLPCIIDGKPIPRDIMIAAVSHASRPFSTEPWEYRKTLGIACAVVRKYYNDQYNQKILSNTYQERWKVELDQYETDRSYLFGRMLAYARRIEEYAQYKRNNAPRQTNAERFMLQFQKVPEKTWVRLYHQLLPYLSTFRTESPNSIGNRYEAALNAIVEQLRISGGYTNDALSPIYLLGYQCQMNQFEQEILEAKSRRAAVENTFGDDE